MRGGYSHLAAAAAALPFVTFEAGLAGVLLFALLAAGTGTGTSSSSSSSDSSCSSSSTAAAACTLLSRDARAGVGAAAAAAGLAGVLLFALAGDLLATCTSSSSGKFSSFAAASAPLYLRHPPVVRRP